MTFQRHLIWLTFLFAAHANGSAAQAQSVLEDVLQCRQIENDVERLTCFDRESDKLASNKTAAAAEIAPSTQPVEPDLAAQEALLEELKSERLRQFGLAENRTQAPETAEKAAQPSTNTRDLAEEIRAARKEPLQISAGITAFARTVYGNAIFVLTNGQVWKEIESEYRQNPKEGTAISIKKNRFGGYRLKADGYKGFARVKRTQ